MNEATTQLEKYFEILKHRYLRSCTESTYAGYKSALRKVCLEIAENYDFKSLKYSDVISIITGWQDEYAHKTINNRLIVLRDLTEMAFEDGYLTKDPCDKIKNLKPDVAVEEKDPFTKSDFQDMENTDTKQPSGKALALLERLIGMRMQEILSLCWSDIDFEKRKLTVRRARAIKCFTQPKTKQSKRNLDLPDEAIAILRDRLTRTGHLPPRLIHIRDASHISQIPHQFRPVFIDDLTGQPFKNSKDYANRFFTEFLKSAGLKHRGPSQLRHSFASITLSAGVPIKLISTMLGHANTTVTEMHYAKWIPVSDEDTRSQLNKALAFDTQSTAQCDTSLPSSKGTLGALTFLMKFFLSSKKQRSQTSYLFEA